MLIVLSAAAAGDDAHAPISTVFVPAHENPVFTAAGDAHWDAAIRERGWILKEGDQWRMWYTGYDGTREGRKKLGLATSPDGIHWTRHPGNPLDDEHWIEDMQVIRHDGRYLMFAEGAGDRAQLLTSDDGIDWTRVGTLDVRLTTGEPIPPGPFGTPAAYFEDDTWNLFYERRDEGVWLATSSDLKTFTNVQDEPVLLPGPDKYDGQLIALNQIIQQNGTYYAMYHGTGTPEAPRLWCTCVATSADLIHWTKHPANPLFPAAENKSSGILVHDGEDWRLYTMHGRVDLHRPAP
ncbi:MAG: glycosylase [Planctomycetaceae bacterium]